VPWLTAIPRGEPPRSCSAGGFTLHPAWVIDNFGQYCFNVN